MAKIKTDSLDKLFRDFIRKRAIQRAGGCERCLTPKFDIQKDNGDVLPDYKQLQCSHFKGRGAHSARFDDENAVGVCGACHLYLGGNPPEHVEFFKRLLGDRYDLLLARARDTSKIDKEAIKLYLQAKIKELEEME